MTFKLNKDLIGKAVEALKGTAYEKNKKIIRKMFNLKCPIILRLRVIDSYYSTNFTKRQFGFEDLAQSIGRLGTDAEVKKRLNNIVANNCLSIDKDIQSLFARNDWGAARKDGRKAGHGQSLISKYFYFLSGFKFPISDSLVKEGIKEIIKGSDPENFTELLERMSDFKKDYRTSYDHLDQFFWLWGKTYNEKYSLLVDDKKIYQRINGKSRKKVCELLKGEKKYNKLRIFIRDTLNAEQMRTK